MATTTVNLARIEQLAGELRARGNEVFIQGEIAGDVRRRRGRSRIFTRSSRSGGSVGRDEMDASCLGHPPARAGAGRRGARPHRRKRVMRARPASAPISRR